MNPAFECLSVRACYPTCNCHKMVCNGLIKATRILMWNRVILWSSPVRGEVFLPWTTWQGHGGCWRASAMSLCSLGSCSKGQRWPGTGNAALQKEGRKRQFWRTKVPLRYHTKANSLSQCLRIPIHLRPPRTHQSTVSCEQNKRAAWRAGVWHWGGFCSARGLRNLQQGP